jgi:hypothetical protein
MTEAQPTLWFEHCQLISAEQSPKPPIKCNQVTAQHADCRGDPGVRQIVGGKIVLASELFQGWPLATDLWHSSVSPERGRCPPSSVSPSRLS